MRRLASLLSGWFGARRRPKRAEPDAQPVALPLPNAISVWDQPPLDRPFYFVHIPKTAGTSLITMLDRLFHQDAIFPAQLWRELTPELVEKADKYRFFRGHFGGGGLKIFPRQPPNLLTLLRDPVSLAVSTYHFVRREANTRAHRLVTSEAMSLAQFVNDPRTAYLVHDRQVRYLSFDIHDDPDAQDIFLSDQSRQVVARWLPENPPRRSDQERFERALALLGKCHWFGIQERFDDSLRLLAWQLGLPPFGVSERLNARPGSTPVGQAEKTAIAARNCWDIRLYRWAVAEFERRFRVMQDSLEHYRQSDADDLDQLLRRAYRHKVNRHLATWPKKALPRTWCGDFAPPLIGSHWHRRELALPEKDWFRWMGPGCEAEIWLVLQAADHKCQLDIINAPDAADLDALQLWANGQRLSLRVVHGQGRVVRRLETVIPATVLADSSLLQLRFVMPRTVPHVEAFGSDDSRRVGMAVRCVCVQPMA